MFQPLVHLAPILTSPKFWKGRKFSYGEKLLRRMADTVGGENFENDGEDGTKNGEQMETERVVEGEEDKEENETTGKTGSNTICKKGTMIQYNYHGSNKLKFKTESDKQPERMISIHSSSPPNRHTHT